MVLSHDHMHPELTESSSTTSMTSHDNYQLDYTLAGSPQPYQA